MTRNVRHLWSLALLVGVSCSFGIAWAGPKTSRRVLILVPEHKAYQAAASACETALKEKGLIPRVITLPSEPSKVSESCRACHYFAAPASGPDTATSQASTSPDFGPLSRPAHTPPVDLVITLGDQAAIGVLKHHHEIPIVFGMISNALDSPVTNSKEYRQRVAGVTADMNPGDHLKWLRKLDPRLRHICVPHSNRSVRTAQSIKSIGTELGLSVTLLETSKDDFAHTVEDLSKRKCDAVLMIADAEIYNSVSIRRLLVWGIRQKRAVWAFSENFVKAGALGCVSAEPEDIGRQAASVAIRIINGTRPDKIGTEYPKQIKVAFNERTAKLIDLSPPFGALENVKIFGHEE